MSLRMIDALLEDLSRLVETGDADVRALERQFVTGQDKATGLKVLTALARRGKLLGRSAWEAEPARTIYTRFIQPGETAIAREFRENPLAFAEKYGFTNSKRVKFSGSRGAHVPVIGNVTLERFIKPDYKRWRTILKVDPRQLERTHLTMGSDASLYRTSEGYLIHFSLTFKRPETRDSRNARIGGEYGGHAAEMPPIRMTDVDLFRPGFDWLPGGDE